MKRVRMKAGSVLLLGIVVAAALTAACGGSGSKAAPDAYGERNPVKESASSVTVELSNLQFVPQGIRIKVGTKVTWVNKDVAVHNVSQINSVFLSTTDLKEDDIFSFTFDKPGTYKYQCTYHHPNMNGVVIVEA